MVLSNQDQVRVSRGRAQVSLQRCYRIVAIDFVVYASEDVRGAISSAGYGDAVLPLVSNEDS